MRDVWEPDYDFTEVTPHTKGYWIITDPTSHPVWNQYMASIVDLEVVEGEKLPVVHGDFSHEFLMFALDPEFPVTNDWTLVQLQEDIHVLTPMNFGYQFKTESDDLARDRVKAILLDAPSMDTDLRQWWDNAFIMKFSGAFSIVK